MVEPGTTVVVPFVLVIPRSVIGAAIALVAVAALFPVAGSGVVALVTVAVFTIGSGVVYPGGIANVADAGRPVPPAGSGPERTGVTCARPAAGNEGQSGRCRIGERDADRI